MSEILSDQISKDEILGNREFGATIFRPNYFNLEISDHNYHESEYS